MKQPTPIFRGYSWLGILNMLVIQWFFIRLQLTCDGGVIVGWKLIGFIVPLTGWWSPYIWLKKLNVN
jgi:hypothetical protein